MTATDPDTEAAQVDQQAVNFVRDGFRGAALQFRVECRNLATFRECVWNTGDYLSPTHAIETLSGVLAECSQIEIGREFSPVIYAHVPLWTHHTYTARAAGQHEGERIPESERETMAARIMAAGQAAGADETSVQLVPHDAPPNIRDAVISVRLWWD